MDLLETVNKNSELFRKYNDLKYQRFQNLIPNSNMRRTLNAIPYLLSINHKKLPGYVEGDVPLGVYGFYPDDETKKYLKGKFPVMRLEPVIGKYFVEMLAVMGSVGTVAYNKKSDFDYWVCVNRDHVTPEQYRNFVTKVQGVQRWVESEIKVPVHLFINDVRSIKQNVFAEDDEEAFGTAVGAVLKDEFFRSSIIIAGKIPFWWVLPHFVRDSDYDELYTKMPEQKQEEYLDLGNLFEISKEDFLGGALFQIIKSLGNPFKSIIKIGILEKYIFGEGGSPLLSQKIKLNILRDNLSNAVIDSYLLLFDEVFNYYSSVLDDKELIDILKLNLYLKVDPQISKYAGIKNQKNIPHKVATMLNYVNAWGWDIKTIRDLDNFDEWDFNRVMKFWDTVKRFMLQSYQKIATQIPSLRPEKKISESDFTLLSRKIKSHFSREKGKIDNFITFKDTPSESILYIEPLSQGIQDVEWRLFKRKKSEDENFATTTLRVEKELLHLLVWMAVNKIYDPVFSRLNIQSGYTRINQNLVTEFLNQVTTLYSGNAVRIMNQYYLQQSFSIVNLVIINFNIENASEIHKLWHLYYSSWGESYIREYKTEEDLARILHLVLKDGLKTGSRFDDFCIVNTPEPHKKIYKTYINLFKQAYNCLVETKGEISERFVAQFGNKVLMFTRTGNDLTANLFSNYARFITALSLKPVKKVRYHFFGENAVIKNFDSIYSVFSENTITVVYEERGDFLFIYVLNENGNLFIFTKNIKVKEQYLMSLLAFCKNTIKHVNRNVVAGRIEESRIRFFRIVTDRLEKISLQEETRSLEGRYLTSYRSSGTLSASVSRHMSQETFYDITFPDGMSSGLMTINEIYSILDKIKKLKIQGYPVDGFINEVSFSDLSDTESQWGSIHYFFEKSKIEFIMDKKNASRT